MIVLVAGGGRVGVQLAEMLIGQGHDVRVTEHRREILARMHRELPTEVIYEGDSTDPTVLERAGIREAEVVAACTASDADNLAVCYIARVRYAVARTIARINDPPNAWLFDQKFHVDVPLNQVELMANLIQEELSLGDMFTLLKLRRGQYSLVEERVPAGAKAVGVAIKDLALPEHCVIAGIIRQGDLVVPRGITILEVDDEVLAVTDSEGAAQLALLLGPGNGAGAAETPRQRRPKGA